MYGVRFQLIYFSSKSGSHATPGRSPLTAATRQCSRRPARHVVVHSQFSPTAFMRFNQRLRKKAGMNMPLAMAVPSKIKPPHSKIRKLSVSSRNTTPMMLANKGTR